VAGTGGAQLVTLAAIPFLTRAYGPSDFGVLALVVAVATIISTVSSGRYEAAIPFRKAVDDSATLLILCLGLLVIVATLVVVVSEIPVVSSLMVNGVSSSLIASFVVVLGLVNVMSFWSVRAGRFKLMSFSRLTHAAVTVSSQLLLADRFGGAGLIGGALVGYTVFAGLLLIPSLILDRKSIFKGETVARLPAVTSAYREFPLFASWSVLLNSLSNQLPNILFFKFGSPVIAGLVSMANRAVRAPLAIVGQSVYQVVAQHVGHHIDDRGKVVDDSRRVVAIMANVAAVPFLLLCFVLEPAFRVVLGAEWEEAGHYARLMLPWLFILLLCWPLTATYNTLGKQRQLLYFNIAFLVCATLPIVLLLWGYTVTLVVTTISVLSAFARFAYLAWILRPEDGRKKSMLNWRVASYLGLISVCAFSMVKLDA
jgi:O-antigen/teichoic acid export membrane protein